MSLDYIHENPKVTMRREAERVRATLTLTGEEGEQAAQHFMDHLTVQDGQVIALYLPIRRELDTIPLVSRLLDAGVKMALPVIDPPKKTMVFREWHPDVPLTLGPYDILVPPADAAILTPDIYVVPLLAFDRRGYRLGYGGGYYDRVLAGHTSAITVGYAYAEQICLFNLPREEHDIPLQFVVTPQQVHDFRNF